MARVARAVHVKALKQKLSEHPDYYTYIRYLRAVLGEAMRVANDSVKPLQAQLERGERWEEEEIVSALLAADELADVSEEVEVSLKAFLIEAGARDVEEMDRRRLAGARHDIERGIRIIHDIDATEIRELAELWVPLPREGVVGGRFGVAPERISIAHETYFFRSFAGAMRRFRWAWNKLFYATQRPRVKKMKLTKRQTDAWDNPLVLEDIRAAVRQEADREAERLGKYVEVMSSDGKTILYVADPPTPQFAAEAQMARQRARARKPRLAGAGRVKTGPTMSTGYRYEDPTHGMSAAEKRRFEKAAAAMRPELREEEYLPNHHSPEFRRDVAMFRELWEMDW